MKKVIVIVAFLLAPLAMIGQSAFDKFEDRDDVSVVIVNKNMFDMLSKMAVDVNDPEAQDYIDMAKSLSSLKVFITENKSTADEMKATVNKYLKSSSLKELMRVKDKEANVKFYVKEGKDEDHVSELLMFVSGIKDVETNGRKVETVLLTLTGDIDLTKIGSLTQKMNLPSDLEKAGKKQ